MNTRYLLAEISSADSSLDAMPVWDSDKDDEDLFFPIHACCLTLMEHLCHSRKILLAQTQISKSVPADLEAFCRALSRRRERNGKISDEACKESCVWQTYYGEMGGLEWNHEYYGVRQSWGDGWENQKHGEVRTSTGYVLLSELFS